MPNLEEDEAHVWCAIAVNSFDSKKRLIDILSEDELDRVNRFRFSEDRDLYLSARGGLRIILSRYLKKRPEELRFSYGSNGKPSLGASLAGNRLRFNVSHSHDLILYAITYDWAIGVDLERVRFIPERDRIAEWLFSTGEIHALRSLSDDLRERAFYKCWTRKEAYVKACGDGLSLPLDRFEVSLLPGEPAALLNVTNDPGEPSRWTLLDLFPDPNYIGALAVKAHDCRLRAWKLSL